MIPNFVRIKTDVSVAPLIEELAKADPKVWREDTYLRDFPQGPFGDTESIILRFPPRSVLKTKEALEQHALKVDQHENVWQPIAQDFPQHKRVVYKLAYETGATRIGRVMINKLKEGGRIYRHADTFDHAYYWSRFHIVIGALPGTIFTCGETQETFSTGEVFFFRNEMEHEVFNESAAPRIHMIVDLKVEEIKPGLIPTPEKE